MKLLKPHCKNFWWKYIKNISRCFPIGRTLVLRARFLHARPWAQVKLRAMKLNLSNLFRTTLRIVTNPNIKLTCCELLPEIGLWQRSFHAFWVLFLLKPDFWARTCLNHACKSFLVCFVLIQSFNCNYEIFKGVFRTHSNI